MSARIFFFKDFYGFLQREFSRIKRYDMNKTENISVLFLQTPIRYRDAILSILKNNLRNSDALFENNGLIFLLLSNTDRRGSTQIHEIIKEFFDDEVACVISSYPEDGDNLSDIIELLTKVAKDDFGIELGSYLKN